MATLTERSREAFLLARSRQMCRRDAEVAKKRRRQDAQAARLATSNEVSWPAIVASIQKQILHEVRQAHRQCTIHSFREIRLPGCTRPLIVRSLYTDETIKKIEAWATAEGLHVQVSHDSKRGILNPEFVLTRTITLHGWSQCEEL